MEDYILNRKPIALEKNKDTALPIPVLFNAASCLFIIEVEQEQFKEGLTFELSIYQPTSSDKQKKVQVVMRSPIERFKISDFETIEPKEHILYSFRSSHALRLSLTIMALANTP